MADLIITTDNVKPGDDAKTELVTAGDTITAGQPVYKNNTDGEWYRADADASLTAATATALSLTSANDGEALLIQTSGKVSFGAILTQSEVYVVSGNAGGIAPCADLGIGDYTCVVMISNSTSEAKLVFSTNTGARP